VALMSERDWVVVFRTGEDLEMELIKGLLTTSGIPVVVEAKGAKSMPVIMGVASTGEYLLKVPPEWAETARALIEAPVEDE
jgi:hypothetical protein